ncbi:C40 family peptidase [Solicola gregarius]|uniref:C40 family peptidase n=1 Tax=Solicola gregarius TaxID=2908642 RepID=A0AA46TFE5_9ACTN|nr:C40 family peptidase [Solicola gregarius]UYM04101.1 C40 family peptidase [Solicola gregarius]
MLASTPLRRFAALPVTLLLAGATVVATPHTADAASPDAARSNHKIQKAMKVAKRQLGDPYVYGATGPGSFDCSGLTSYAYHKAGIRLPRTSDSQARAARSVSRKNLRRGDLIFFHSGGNVYHVGIFWGAPNGKRLILHAPRPGQRVSFSRLWTNSWFAGRVGPKHSAPKINGFNKRQGKSVAQKPKTVGTISS